MTLNKMMIIGNLGADPELRYTPGGKAVAELRVAVNDRSKGPAAERLRKGHKVFAEGQLRAREWEGKDGQKRTSLEIRFARVQSLERRDPAEGGGYAGGFGDGAMDAPPAAARPRGAAQPAAAEVEAIDVDDIPF